MFGQRRRLATAQSSGAVGSMQATLQEHVSTLRTDLEMNIKIHNLTRMAVQPWPVRHSVWLVERWMRANGRTSYQDCFVTVYTGIVLRLGEQAVFRHLVETAAGRNRQNFKQMRQEKAANKMDIGIWLGKTCDTDEHFFLETSDGIFTTRTCRRLAADQQWNLERASAVTGVRWYMGAGRLTLPPETYAVSFLSVVGLDTVCDGNVCCKVFSWSLGRIIPCPHDAFRFVVGWPKMPGIMVGMDQKDSCVDEEAHVLTMKYPIDHTDNDSGMYKAEVAGNDALDAVLRSIVGGYNMPCIMVGMDQESLTL